MAHRPNLLQIASRLAGLSAIFALACSDSGDDPGNGGQAGATSSGGTSGTGGEAGAGEGAQAGAGGGTSDELCGARPGGSVWSTHRIRFESADADIVVQLQRTFETNGVGESSIYRLDVFALRIGTSTTCVTDAENLEYENTHHNWQDVARADVGGTSYELRMSFIDAYEWSNTLSAADESGNVVLEETPLILTGSPVSCYECPGTVPVFVSEVQFDNVSTLADEADEYEPWIEIFNPSVGDVDLTGFTLSDDFGERGKWTFPAVSIPRHEAIVVFADGDVDQGELHTSFELGRDVGALVLTMPDGITEGGFVHEAPGADTSSMYDWPASTYVATDQPTPGAGPTE